jgi:hypothetical protein
MSHHWDEFSKSLAEKSVPRRQSLRLLGAALAGALFSPLGTGIAWASRPDPCKSFCRCRNQRQQTACLPACRACGNDTNRLCGTCGSYVCCAEPGPYENGACVDGQCFYWCAPGAVECLGICTSLADDPYNCGACGNVCPASSHYCDGGTCVCPGIVCDGQCVDPLSDSLNCGGCGQTCQVGSVCAGGICCDPTVQDCFGSSDPPWW